VGEGHDADVLYAEATKIADKEKFEDAGSWFATVQQADKLHKKRFEKALKEM
jgi:rubrerythrin